MQALLSQLRERLGPDWDASRLADMPIDEAKAWLTELPGVGPKTAACVLLFSLGRPALPVDTHVHRVAQRLGLIGSKIAAVPAHDMLEAQLPPDRYYDFHVTLNPPRTPRLPQAAPKLRRLRPARPLPRRRRHPQRLTPKL